MNKGLLPFIKDKRDYSHSKTFGTTSPVLLPLNGPELEPLEINQQLSTNFCTACATSESGEQTWESQFSPEYQMMSINRVMGKNTDSGADLRSAMTAGVKYGFLPRQYSPFSLGIQDSNFIANPANWPDLAHLDAIAAKYKEDGFYAVDGSNDMFDNIRTTQFTASQDPNDNRRTVIVGTPWFQEWNLVGRGGIIPMPQTAPISLHCHLEVTWKTINGVPYLMNQNSEGADYGDNGKMYFPREVVDKYFTQGAFIFRKNPDPTQIKTISTLLNLISQLLNLYQSRIKTIIQH